jgi:prolyl oligopeptidase
MWHIPGAKNRDGEFAMKIAAKAMRAALIASIVVIAVGMAHRASCQSGPSSVEQPDNYTWLEDIHGAKPMAWVNSENAKTEAWLNSDPNFAALQAKALTVLDSPDRIAFPSFMQGIIYNSWTDANHVRGIVRRTTLADYLTAEPHWETVLDYDALGAAEKQSWVGRGLTCLRPEEEICLASLSAGGEDAVTVREFSLKTNSFVENGFVLPRGKQSVAWLDKDTLLISRDWGPGTMSQAGYPITVREWKRGTPLESAKEIFRGEVTDNGYGDHATVLRDGEDHVAVILEQSASTFEHATFLQSPAGPRKLAIPLKSSIVGFLANHFILTLQEDWTPAGETTHYPQGSVLSIDYDAAKADPEHLKPTVIFTPSEREFMQAVRTTKNHLLLTTLNNVQARAYIYSLEKSGKWTRKAVPIPENQTAAVVWASPTEERFFVSLNGFINPPSLWLGNAADSSLKQIKSEKPQFDASNLAVHQYEATSKDGTRVPYFVVGPKGMKFDGQNPTLLTAYGGFQVSQTPGYSPTTGKLWLERGGVYVLANIRGGGEFGPAWHDAGLKTHRQRIYDDFYAVAQDLTTRKITSPARLGIEGGSNGGLLMGVEFTEHPEMWKAVIISVPLLDMLAFEHLSAGASWVGEYGSVSVPEERKFLASISPYNQLRKDVNYPEPLIFTTTKDDRVGPVHARKFAARMEEFGKPFHYFEITEGGHGAGADNKQRARTDAAMYTYLAVKLMN